MSGGLDVKGREEKVYLLKKSLHGLKTGVQQNLMNFLIVLEPTLGLKQSGANIFAISVHVDDLLVTRNKVALLKEFITRMMKAFEMTGLDLMAYFLGMEVKQNDDVEKVNENQHKILTGCLMYLTLSQPPDQIIFYVSLLSRFQHHASEVHFQAAK